MAGPEPVEQERSGYNHDLTAEIAEAAEKGLVAPASSLCDLRALGGSQSKSIKETRQ
jgi:hypothetical protein